MRATCLFLRFWATAVFCTAAGVASARLPSTTLQDIQSMLKSGQESAAELTSYFYLRIFPTTTECVDVKFVLAEIYERQTRFEEMVLWLKDLERDPRLKDTLQPKLAYMLYNAQAKRGDKPAAEIQRSLILRKYPNSEWAKKVNNQ